MRFTNKHNIADYMCRAFATDDYDYDPGVISATTLLKPARAWALNKKHAGELALDYSSLIRSFAGTAVHNAIERTGALANGDFQERRFYAEIGGFKVSGKLDLFVAGQVRDIKCTGVWKYVKQDFADYVAQLSIYRWLLNSNGIEAKSTGLVHFVFNDWKKSDSLRGGGYPSIPYAEQQVELWSTEDTELFIQNRLKELSLAGNVLPQCTPKELWATSDKFAVYKKTGNIRAAKLCDSKAEAEEYAKTNKCEQIELRKGKAKRCNYCTAAPFCEQYQTMVKNGEVEPNED